MQPAQQATQLTTQAAMRHIMSAMPSTTVAIIGAAMSGTTGAGTMKMTRTKGRTTAATTEAGGAITTEPASASSGHSTSANPMPSKSPAQARLMAAAAHNKSFAKKVGVPQSVAKEFNQADTGTNIRKAKPAHLAKAVAEHK
jgi:hypothetical protein